MSWKQYFAINKLFSKQIILSNGKQFISPSLETGGLKYENMKVIASSQNIYTHNLNSFLKITTNLSNNGVYVDYETNSQTTFTDDRNSYEYNCYSNIVIFTGKYSYYYHGYWDDNWGGISNISFYVNNETINVNNVHSPYVTSYQSYYYDYRDRTEITYNIKIIRVYPYSQQIKFKKSTLGEKSYFSYLTKTNKPMSINNTNVICFEDKLNDIIEK